MRVAIYSPYLDTAGGGEKYMLTIAEILSGKNQVDVLLDNHLSSLDIPEIKERIEKLHGLDLSNVNFTQAPIGKDSDFLKRLFFLQKYDLFFSNTDGSILYSPVKKSILHFQVPFENVNGQGVWGKIKQSSWYLAICNSMFTKGIIQKSWQIKCQAVYPPVEVEKFLPATKNRQIVSVGRFVPSKKHSVLIKAFKKMVDQGLKDWSLHIAGGAQDGDSEYIEELKDLVKGYQINFYENLPMERLTKLYGESKIYWHAAGFLEKNPKNFEHFGITTVEAMAAGCVPVVVKKGGQIEIIEEKKSGLFWENVEQLIELTKALIQNSKQMEELSKNATLRSKKFSRDEFKKRIEGIAYAN